MPCNYHINADDGLVTIQGSAYVGLMDAIELGRKLITDQQFDPKLPHLLDLRGLLFDPQSRDKPQFRDFVLHEYQPRVEGLVAVVINDSLDRLSTAALFHLTTRVRQCEIFDNYAQALRWLMRNQFAPASHSRESG